MSKTSSAVKNRYAKKAYDRLTITVPKGTKDILKALCAENGDTINGIVKQAVKDYIDKHQQ